MARAPAPRPFRLRSPVIREHPLQRQIARLLTIEIALPGHASPFGVWWTSIDHASPGTIIHATRARRGVVSGLPDLYIEYHGRAHWIEIKAADGRLTPGQHALGISITACGGRCAVAKDGN